MNQLAFKDPDEALNQFLAYVDEMAAKKEGWTPERVAAIKETANEAYEDSVSVFRGSQAETDLFWLQLKEEMPNTINQATNNNPSSMAKINSFYALLGAGSIAANAETQNSGINLVGNVLQSQLEDVAKESKETKEKFDKWIPLGVIAFGVILAYRLTK